MNRIKKVQELLERENLDALVVDYPIDLFYLTRLNLSLGRLVIGKEMVQLFVDGRYFESCQDKLPIQVVLTSGYDEESHFFKEWKYGGKRVGFDSQFTAYATYLQLQELHEELIPLKGPIKQIREIKEEDEITLLRNAARLGSTGYDFVIDFLREGVTEWEIALELELSWRKAGGDRLGFDPHIAFGTRTSMPHCRAGKHALKKEDPILIDIGVVLNHYHSDMTRVVFWKAIDGEMKQIYQIVQEAQQKALEKCRPGVLIGDVDRAARDWIAHRGYGKYFPHSLGHGVGLEIHESPVIHSRGKDANRPLREGMVITIEPGIYVPGKGGVRLEDTIVITKQGYENLTMRPLSDIPPIVKEKKR